MPFTVSSEFTLEIILFWNIFNHDTKSINILIIVWHRKSDTEVSVLWFRFETFWNASKLLPAIRTRVRKNIHSNILFGSRRRIFVDFIACTNRICFNRLLLSRLERRVCVWKSFKKSFSEGIWKGRWMNMSPCRFSNISWKVDKLQITIGNQHEK